MSVSRPVHSRQTRVHPDLERVLDRHHQHQWQAPVRAHNRLAWQTLQLALQNTSRPLILDSGCGTGASSRKLADLWPQHSIIGIDKSAARLGSNSLYQCSERVLLLRADAEDIWRLMLAAGWRIDRHYLLYPNPWPKPAHLRRRWHGHPAFPLLPQLSRHLELRSNWRLYAQEFARALSQHTHSHTLATFIPEDPVSPFERKYHHSGHQLYRVTACFD